MRTLAVWILLLSLPGGALAPDDRPALSDTLAFSTYFEKVGGVVVVVDSFLASQRAAEGFIPLRVLVLVDEPGPVLEVTPRSFALADESGLVQCAATAAAIREDYRKEGFDAGVLSRLPLQVGLLKDNRWEVDSSFYPAPGRGLRVDDIQLSGYTWFEDVVYFAQPAAGLDGVLTLHFAAKGLKQPIAVRFRVPLVEKRS